LEPFIQAVSELVSEELGKVIAETIEKGVRLLLYRVPEQIPAAGV
jgi:hypothetical protein